MGSVGDGGVSGEPASLHYIPPGGSRGFFGDGDAAHFGGFGVGMYQYQRQAGYTSRPVVRLQRGRGGVEIGRGVELMAGGLLRVFDMSNCGFRCVAYQYQYMHATWQASSRARWVGRPGGMRKDEDDSRRQYVAKLFTLAQSVSIPG